MSAEKWNFRGKHYLYIEVNIYTYSYNNSVEREVREVYIILPEL